MVRLKDIYFSYPEGSFSLCIPAYALQRGERQLLMAPSGEGKTTMLGIISGLLLPEKGSVSLGSLRIDELSTSERRLLRLEKMGIIFQDLELLEYLTVYDNIRLNFLLGRTCDQSPEDLDRDIRILAEEAGIEDKLRRFPAKLSKGEQQRTALCRALLSKPELILADEATGNLDEQSKEKIWDMVSAYCRKSGASVLAASHDRSLSARFDSLVNLEEICRRDGRV